MRPATRATALVVLVVAACTGPPSTEPPTVRHEDVQPAPGAPDAALAAPRVRRDPTGVRVALVGIDGATFDVIDPMVGEGKLPNLARMMAGGARGVLMSEEPMKSPALWTTIATGKAREVHGIHDFTVADVRGKRVSQRLPITADRKSLALWNIASAGGLRVGFAGWWVTWPAEPVNGWMVTDRLSQSKWVDWFDTCRENDLTFPASLAEEVGPLRLDPMDPPVDEILALAPFDDLEMGELLAAQEPIYGHALSVLKFSYCTQRSIERIGLAMLSRGQPDLYGVFLNAVDTVSHTFWHYYEPGKFRAGRVDLDDAARLGRTIPAVYEESDRHIGDLQELLDPATVVIVLSDHGFKASRVLPRPLEGCKTSWFADEMRAARLRGEVAAGQSGMHDPRGILVAAGGPIARGARVEATIADVAPTVLALLGMPVPDDMPGRVLEEIIEPGFLAAHPVRRIRTYEDGRGGAMERPGEEASEEQLRMLRALGYID